MPPSTPGATRFARVRARLEAFEPRPGWHAWVYEFLLFGFKQGWACLFGALLKNEQDVMLFERLAFMSRRQSK